MAKIELKGLGHAYNFVDGEALFALYPLDLTWEDGGTYALLGPSGCGKSTMLNIVSGLLTPSKGKVFINGKDVTALGPIKRNIAQVFQFPVVYPAKTVYANLAFPLICRHTPKKLIDQRVNEVAELLDLEKFLKKPAYKLTPDLKQLISLGRGLVRDDVAVILMDEPLTVIDPQLKFSLRRKLRDISARHGHTLVYVTHDQNEAMTLAEQVVVMDNGKVVQMGTPQELFENPVHRHVGYFIGTPSMNFLSGKLDGRNVRVVGQKVGKPINKELTGVSDVLVGIRPEFIKIKAKATSMTIPALIVDVQDMGGFAIVSARLDDKSLVKVRAYEHIPPLGTQCQLDLQSDWVRFYVNDQLVS